MKGVSPKEFSVKKSGKGRTAMLGDFIRATHLEKEAMAMYARLSKEELLSGCYIDDFIHPSMVNRVVAMLRNEVEFEEQRILYGAAWPEIAKFRGKQGEAPPSDQGSIVVSPEEFDLFNDQQLVFRRRLKGIKEEYKMSPNWLTYLKLIQFFDFELPLFLKTFVGVDLVAENILLNADKKEHFTRPHSDDQNSIRKICVILYLTPNWDAEYGGALMMKDSSGRYRGIAPLFNRFFFFIPGSDSIHYVDNLTEKGQYKTRFCLVAWYAQAENS